MRHLGLCRMCRGILTQLGYELRHMRRILRSWGRSKLGKRDRIVGIYQHIRYVRKRHSSHQDTHKPHQKPHNSLHIAYKLPLSPYTANTPPTSPHKVYNTSSSPLSYSQTPSDTHHSINYSLVHNRAVMRGMYVPCSSIH